MDLYSGNTGVGSVAGGRADPSEMAGVYSSEDTLPNFLLSSGYNPAAASQAARAAKTPDRPHSASKSAFGRGQTPRAFNDRVASPAGPFRSTASGGERSAAGPGAAKNIQQAPGAWAPQLANAHSTVAGGAANAASSPATPASSARPPPRRSMLDEPVPDVSMLNRTPAANAMARAPFDQTPTHPPLFGTPQRSPPPTQELPPMHTPDSGIMRTPATNRHSLAPTPGLTPARGGALHSPAAYPPLDGDLPKWVTVFGFGTSMISTVLREFRRHGEIVRHVVGDGNWVHIQYRTGPCASLALSKPTRIVNKTTMVGVMECTDAGILRSGSSTVADHAGPLSSPNLYGSGAESRGPPTPASAFRQASKSGIDGSGRVVSRGSDGGVLGRVADFFF